MLNMSDYNKKRGMRSFFDSLRYNATTRFAPPLTNSLFFRYIAPELSLLLLRRKGKTIRPRVAQWPLTVSQWLTTSTEFCSYFLGQFTVSDEAQKVNTLVFVTMVCGKKCCN